MLGSWGGLGVEAVINVFTIKAESPMGNYSKI